MQLARAVLTFAILVVGGTVGYMLIEGWSLVDAAYMVVLTFTTVGYGEVNPLSSNGRLFTMALMLAGIGVMFYILTGVVQLVVEQEVLRGIGCVPSSPRCYVRSKSGSMVKLVNCLNIRRGVALLEKIVLEVAVGQKIHP